MYVNDRDQINYHGFLTALRTMHGYLLKHVSTGVCCESGMNRFEKGNRVAEKLVRDRLTARLGVSCEKYEDYLQPKEYVRWEQRMRIIKAIEKRKLKVAKQEVKDYEESLKLNRTNQQFVEAMRFMILFLEGATEEQRYSCIKKAVKLTVPNPQKAFAGEYLLADQEVNLLLEQMHLETPKKVVRDEKAWRISEYEKLITYIENSCWEKLQKAKVYPKVAYYICKELLSKELTETEIRRGLELCHNAIELLRDCSRLYYFIELTESRRVLTTQLMKYDISSEEKTKLEEMLTENNQWETVFKDLYAEYKVAPYMSDFCFLYYENECHNMVEVIETRRNMLGLSRAKLGEGICTDKTIIRLEREGVNPSVELVRRLFDKMGMCAEYRRARVVTTDVNALMLSMEVARNINDRNFSKASKLLEKLKEKIDLNVLHNKQQMLRFEALIDFRRQIIGRDELYERTQRAINYTLPINTLSFKGQKIFTRSELACVFDLAFKLHGDISESSINIMDELVSIVMMDGVSLGLITKYELITNEYASYLGNSGKYIESSDISKKMLKECLTHRRILVAIDHLYNITWNSQRTGETTLDKIQYKKYLTQCLAISCLLKRKSRIAFFQEKLNN